MNLHDSAQSSRRHFLSNSSLSLSSVALAWLLNKDISLGEEIKPELERVVHNLKPKEPAFEAKATSMISLWMQGGPSHIDLFDPKPDMEKYDGKKYPGELKYDNAAQASAKVLASPWKFSPQGECGTELSELLPHTSSIVDDICLIRSMHTDVNNHGQSIRAFNTGKTIAGRPGLGSWLTYALGSENQNLPAYMALIDPGQLPVLGVENWSNGWLPSLYQGTVVRPQEPRILNLDAPSHIRGEAQQRYLSLLNSLNQNHLKDHPGELDLQARIASYELAGKMQTSAKEALDLSQETQETKKMYGLEDAATRDYGTRCLIARRLVERGVRFVQVFTQNQFWDHHGSIRKKLPDSCKKVDQPSAALVKDLKRRGLLDSTLVQWGGEMGRLPVIQNDTGEAKVGRDHNTYGFSMWLAGGGIQGGMTFGNTDEFGHKAVENPVSHNDFHATLCHLFGLDIKRLHYLRNNQPQFLVTEQDARVVKEILA
ncbi:MAG: hypothetical protein COA78_28740 [Blastopirellula sp.]|nr:MAG: hypothetical protein COA78_28740 [Blastopirellula sp.]